MNKRVLLIFLLLLAFSVSLDHSHEITEKIDELVPGSSVTETPENKTESFNSSQEIDDWQYNSQLRSPRGSRNETKNEDAVLLRYTSGALYGHTHKALTESIVANPIPLAVIFLAQGSLGDFGANSMQASSQLEQPEDLGLRTGGAQDVNNFRENIENGFLPLSTDISYEGLFHEYYFQTDQQEECQNLFCPSYSKAVSEDPLSEETEYYTTVGLNSNLNEQDFNRKKLNLVVVMDISGSMGSSFDRYYYDRFNNRHEVENYTDDSKIEIAKRSLKGLTEHLRPSDNLGIVLFNRRAYKAKPVNKVGQTDMDAIRTHIMNDIRDGGGTNMESGMEKASSMLEEYQNADQSEYENRIIYMTDAMPNIGTKSDDGLMNMARENADDNIHTSFIGMGVDFNTELVDSITSIKGANYYSVHSSDQFHDRMDRNFEYMVTPLVYNLEMKLNSDSYRIKKVYGSTAAEESTGSIMKVNTLFPSPKKDGKTRGGVVLTQLEKTGGDEPLSLTVSYEKRNGEQRQVTDQIDFKGRSPEYFETSGVRKAILLTRYSDLMKNWIEYERDDLDERNPARLPQRYRSEGIEPAPVIKPLGDQERTSEPLELSQEYEDRINKFLKYYRRESDRIGDRELEQETEMMEEILSN